MKPIFSLLLFGLMSQVYGQSVFLDPIPDTLLENANAVIRQSKTVILVKESSIVRKESITVTILNELGDGHATLFAPEGKFYNRIHQDAKVYDKEGNLLKEYTMKDFKYIGLEDFSSVSDVKYYRLNVKKNQYPYTVEYNKTVEETSLFGVSSWTPCQLFGESVQKAEFIIELSPNNRLEIKEFGIEKLVEGGNLAGKYVWNIKNLCALKKEKYVVDKHLAQPSVFYRFEKFKFDKKEQVCNNWNDFSKWYAELNESSYELNEEAKNKFRSLVMNATNLNEKLKILHNYLKNNTRYVSIQLGEGGLKSMNVQKVYDNKFGDCKALTSFLKSGLQSVGIESYPVLVHAGDKPVTVFKDLVGSYFNHVILAVPAENDTIWVECTSQSQPLNYLGRFSDDRLGLWISKEGGELVKTPNYNKEEENNISSLNGVVHLNGSLELKRSDLFTGNLLGMGVQILSAREELLKKFINENYSYPGVKIKQINSEQSTPKEVLFNSELSIEKFVSIKGKYRIFQPILDHNSLAIKTEEDRKCNFGIHRDKIRKKEFDFKIPKEWSLKNLPEPMHLTSKYGEYKNEYFYENNVLKIHNFLKINHFSDTKENYQEFAEFMNKVNKREAKKIVFLVN